MTNSKVSIANVALSGKVKCITHNSEIKSFISTSEEPSEEKVYINLVHWYFRSTPSNDFKDIEFIRNPNVPLNDWSP
jgi:hypothetical protein